ncbi:hypothetical protein SDC9_174573 [bioreactor metagenome]|uniref:Uncharacterized protein n=1 Tax=bioreactor metagenome TaxID=1076179 RepID=A0A645GLQ4_9ZZZZ
MQRVKGEVVNAVNQRTFDRIELHRGIFIRANKCRGTLDTHGAPVFSCVPEDAASRDMYC